MVDCQWLLAGQTENQIMLLGQHKCHHPQEAFPASYPDPTTSPDCISPPRSHGPGAFPAHLRANVTSDDLAAGTVRRHHIDLPSLPGSAPQFLSLSFFNCKMETVFSSSTKHWPCPETVFGNNLTTQSSCSCNMIVPKETTWKPRITKEHSVGPAQWWQPPPPPPHPYLQPAAAWEQTASST